MSHLGEATTLLSFIPGVSIDNEGGVSLLGAQGEVAVYINRVKMRDIQKLHSLKSEDIRSVEVLRNPGAKYRGSEAVILITTNKEREGFSSRVSTDVSYSAKDIYTISPKAEVTYTKGKITASLSYNYTDSKNKDLKTSHKIIDELLSPIEEEWNFRDTSNGYSDNSSHWYSANLDYRVNEKNFINFQYSGSFNNSGYMTDTHSAVHKDNSIIENNYYGMNESHNPVTNTAHLYYSGNYTPNFGLEFNADFSNSLRRSVSCNTWLQDGQSISSPDLNTKINAAAFTTDLILNNKFGQKHELTYGLEYSYLKDDVTAASQNIDYPGTSYKQNSNFLKTILEYKIRILPTFTVAAGFNYMYSLVDDNNSKRSYDSYVPELSLQYYNVKRQYAISFSVQNKNFQPDAGSLDDITITYISPYERRTGNKNLKNMNSMLANFNFSYKTFNAGLAYNHITNMLIEAGEVEWNEDSGKPLITYRVDNIRQPIGLLQLYAGYNRKIKFWTPSLNINLIYNFGSTPGFGNTQNSVRGFVFMAYMNNMFELPKKFNIYLSGYYTSSGYLFSVKSGASYNVAVSIEKRFFHDNLRVSVNASGLVLNKWNREETRIKGIYDRSYSKNLGGRNIGLSISWRFNNHREVQRAKENAYLQMLQ